MNIKRTFDLLDKYRENPVKEDALCFKHNGIWIKYSSKEYIEYAFNIAYGLYEIGLRKGDMIITVSSNRPEWNFADMGMLMIGIVHVPVFAYLNTKEYEYIIQNSGAKLIFISDNKLFKCISPAINRVNTLKGVYTFDEVDGIPNWMELVEKGKACSE